MTDEIEVGQVDLENLKETSIVVTKRYLKKMLYLLVLSSIIFGKGASSVFSFVILYLWLFLFPETSAR